MDSVPVIMGCALLTGKHHGLAMCSHTSSSMSNGRELGTVIAITVTIWSVRNVTRLPAHHINFSTEIPALVSVAYNIFAYHQI